ncbi:MAG: HNH endonuclease [Methylotenera sp.]|nr:HNH endonuclease [Methylotenera sp.]
MPIAAPKPCKQHGCRALTTSGAYCSTHKRVVQKQIEVKRESSTQRGYGYRWQQTSKGFLRSHPLCQCPECQEGLVRLLPAEVVDHIIPHQGDMTLFWNRSNWQAMNKQCHDKKTATQDGGFRGRGQ